MEHSIAREAYSSLQETEATLRVSRKLLITKHIVVLPEGKGLHANAVEHLLVELTRPVHEGRGKHAVREITLGDERRYYGKTLFRTKVRQKVESSTTTVPPPEKRLITGRWSSFALSTFMSLSTFPDRPITMDGFKWRFTKHLPMSPSPSVPLPVGFCNTQQCFLDHELAIDRCATNHTHSRVPALLNGGV